MREKMLMFVTIIPNPLIPREILVTDIYDSKNVLLYIYKHALKHVLVVNIYFVSFSKNHYAFANKVKASPPKTSLHGCSSEEENKIRKRSRQSCVRISNGG